MQNDINEQTLTSGIESEVDPSEIDRLSSTEKTQSEKNIDQLSFEDPSDIHQQIGILTAGSNALDYSPDKSCCKG